MEKGGRCSFSSQAWGLRERPQGDKRESGEEREEDAVGWVNHGNMVMRVGQLE